jgi:hypothetical protein
MCGWTRMGSERYFKRVVERRTVVVDPSGMEK